MLTCIAVNDLSFHCVSFPTFKKFVDDFNTCFHIKSESSLRHEIIKYAEEINRNVLESLNGKQVSILFDGAKRVGINYEGIILYTKERLYFYPFKTLERNNAINISISLSSVINDLNRHNIEIIAVCSDNASANVSAFDKKHFHAVQYRIGEGIYRIPCCAHTAELASGDVFNGSCKGIKNSIIFILKTVPNGLNPTPNYSPTRWKSLYECIEFIYKHQKFYSTHLITSQIYISINSIYSWEVLASVSYIMWILFANLEKYHAILCDVFPYVLEALENLGRYPKSNVALSLFQALQNRFFFRINNESSMSCFSFDA